MNNTKTRKINFKSFKCITPLKVVLIVTVLLGNFGCEDMSDSTRVQKNEVEKPLLVKEKWHWDNPDEQSESAGYAQVVKVGNTIYVSGVPTSNLSPEGISRLYDTLEQSLKAFGATPKDVVKETLYTTDIETMKKYNDVRKEFYKGDYPAASWVQISRLYEPDAKLEVDLIAVITNAKE